MGDGSYLPPPPPGFTPLRPVGILFVGGGGAPVETSDASLTTSINHSPSSHLCAAPLLCLSVCLCLAYTTLISVSFPHMTRELLTIKARREAAVVHQRGLLRLRAAAVTVVLAYK